MNEIIVDNYNQVINNLENAKLNLNANIDSEIASLKAEKDIYDIAQKSAEIDDACQNACNKIREEAEKQVQELVAKAEATKISYRTKVYADVETQVKAEHDKDLVELNAAQDAIRKLLK